MVRVVSLFFTLYRLREMRKDKFEEMLVCVNYLLDVYVLLIVLGCLGHPFPLCSEHAKTVGNCSNLINIKLIKYLLLIN